jgi:hypothetical protein
VVEEACSSHDWEAREKEEGAGVLVFLSGHTPVTSLLSSRLHLLKVLPFHPPVVPLGGKHVLTLESLGDTVPNQTITVCISVERDTAGCTPEY